MHKLITKCSFIFELNSHGMERTALWDIIDVSPETGREAEIGFGCALMAWNAAPEGRILDFRMQQLPVHVDSHAE